MNNFKLIQSFICNNSLKIYFLCLSVFFLPLNMKLNNMFLVCYIGLYFVEGNLKSKFKIVRKNYTEILLVSAFFMFYLLGSVHSEFTYLASKQIERSIPFLVIPIAFLSEPLIYKKNQEKILYSLTFGCLSAAFVCWFVLIYKITINNDFDKILTWQYSKLNLINPINQHSPYLSMFLFTSIGFLATQLKKKSNKYYMLLMIAILFIFNLHLLSRTGTFYLLITSVIFLLYNKNFKFLLFFMLLISLFFLKVINNDNDKNGYFRSLFVEQIGLNGVDQLDDRFERWKYSIQLFRDQPFLGVGTGDVDALRTSKFLENNDIIAFKNSYNAHNQFFEFLSGQGVFAGIFFLFSFTFILFKTLRHNQFFYFFSLFGFFICCITESMFRVSWGIVYFSIISSLFFTIIEDRKNTEQ